MTKLLEPEIPVGENVTKAQPPAAETSPSPIKESPTQEMHIDSEGLAQLKNGEAGGEPLHFSARAYPDGKGYAIGYGMHKWEGQTVTKTYPGVITKDQADKEMENQLKKTYEPLVQKGLGNRQVTQHEFNQLVAAAWNTGSGSLARKLSKLPPGQHLSKEDWKATGTEGGVCNSPTSGGPRKGI